MYTCMCTHAYWHTEYMYSVPEQVGSQVAVGEDNLQEGKLVEASPEDRQDSALVDMRAVGETQVGHQ